MQASTYTVFIKDGQTNSSRWVNIGMEEALWEFTLWWFAWIIFSEVEGKRVITALPVSLQTPQKLNRFIVQEIL